MITVFFPHDIVIHKVFQSKSSSTYGSTPVVVDFQPSLAIHCVPDPGSSESWIFQTRSGTYLRTVFFSSGIVSVQSHLQPFTRPRLKMGQHAFEEVARRLERSGHVDKVVYDCPSLASTSVFSRSRVFGVFLRELSPFFSPNFSQLTMWLLRAGP